MYKYSIVKISYIHQINIFLKLLHCDFSLFRKKKMKRKSIRQKDSPVKRKSLSGSFQQKDLWKFVFLFR